MRNPPPLPTGGSPLCLTGAIQHRGRHPRGDEGLTTVSGQRATICEVAVRFWHRETSSAHQLQRRLRPRFELSAIVVRSVAAGISCNCSTAKASGAGPGGTQRYAVGLGGGSPWGSFTRLVISLKKAEKHLGHVHELYLFQTPPTGD